MERHKNGLWKETQKKKPNVDVVNSFLNKDYSSRRVWLEYVSPAERVELMKKYPCFHDHVEVNIAFVITKYIWMVHLDSSC